MLKKPILLFLAMALIAVLPSLAMAKKEITYDCVKHPNCMVLLLNAMDDEIDALRTLSNELRTDHATAKTAADQTETLVEELHDDHATTKAVVDELVTWAETLAAQINEDNGTIGTDYDDNVTNDGPATLTAPKPSSYPATLTAPAVTEQVDGSK